jgi:FAD:protein FMN transferase
MTVNSHTRARKAPRPSGVLHVEECMGTVFTIDIRDSDDEARWRAPIADAVEWLHNVDGLLSTFKPDSDISRIGRGELAIADAHPLVRQALDLCDLYERETNGYFTAHFEQGLDPTGLVKGWAIERASDILAWHGSYNHAVNGGGDIQMRGEGAPGRPWRVGVNDPHDPTRVLRIFSGTDFAIATSGTSERGEHIVDPTSRSAPAGLASVTVVGPSLTRADVYATAAFAMGGNAVGWLDSRRGHEGLVVSDTGEVQVTGATSTRWLPAA